MSSNKTVNEDTNNPVLDAEKDPLGVLHTAIEKAEEEYSQKESRFSRFVHYFFLPINQLIAWTIPDMHQEQNRPLYWVSAIMSCVWMGALAELMLECLDILGRLMGISPVLMGITISACGASLPTLWSSVAVAKAGFADMAISNALGSNIFCILIGLGLPWFAYPIYIKHEYNGFQDGGIVPLLMLLVIVLLSYYFVIALNGFVMTKW